ncbi:FHA domain-containing protein [Trichocoleus desertorum]|uniref:non-specific serine/threonine protein kinase n=1 Tax=Trichocoleus desertorum GB2-A4 TaxID=2933944 RepID=A0ABV0J899_9CYAN|nr:FHA domain-containing protein [Trichocoleus sp. FACHB-46]
MITLTLLHPLQHIPVQTWVFDQEPVIRIGRSTDNHVVLYSAVVSRHHVEVRRNGSSWEIVSIGTNGTYLEGKRITHAPVIDGVIIRLARSGPNIQIRIGAEAMKELPKTLSGERTLAQQARTKLDEDASDVLEETSAQVSTIPVPPHLRLPAPLEEPDSTQTTGARKVVTVDGERQLQPTKISPVPATKVSCQHQRASPELRFCLDCGEPLQIQQLLGKYQVLQTLNHGEMGITYWAWRDGQSVVLKTLNSEWSDHPQAKDLLAQEVNLLKQFDHPGLPRLINTFAVSGQPYLAMELIYGHSLAQDVAASGPIPLAQAIAWMTEICEALDYLHNLTPPVLHRDIQPQHLIRRAIPVSGHEIALIGFGSVKVAAVEPGKPIGTPGYMAPEQEVGETSIASDLYPLGPLLIYLLTGEDPSLFYGHRDQGARLYAEYVPDLPPALIPVIRTLTHPQPEQRYTTAREVATAIAEIAV